MPFGYTPSIWPALPKATAIGSLAMRTILTTVAMSLTKKTESCLHTMLVDTISRYLLTNSFRTMTIRTRLTVL